MAKTLVTGISGQDGWYLTERLLRDGHEVHGLVRPGDQVSPEFLETYPGVTLHLGELGDVASLREAVHTISPERIVNLGGISSVAYSWAEPVATATVSGVGAAALMHIANEMGGVRFLQASSAEIFGSASSAPQDENTPMRPTSPYGAAKAYAHSMAGLMRAKGLHSSTCILYNHESTRRPPAFVTRKITMGVARIASGLQDTLELGNLDPVKDWGWAPDYVDAMARVLEHPEPDDFVIATGVGHTVEQFVAAAFAAAGIADWSAHVVVNPEFVRPAEPGRLVGDASKAHSELGWTPTVGFTEMVGLMVSNDIALLEAAHGA